MLGIEIVISETVKEKGMVYIKVPDEWSWVNEEDKERIDTEYNVPMRFEEDPKCFEGWSSPSERTCQTLNQTDLVISLEPSETYIAGKKLRLLIS